MSEAVEDFLAAFTAWAEQQPAIAAIALVGSHARGTATDDSDVDLLILGNASALLVDASWAEQFGAIRQTAIEDYGAVLSLRVHYAYGLEVEFGIAADNWVDRPLDPGSAEVIAGGLRVLYDPHGLMKAVLNVSEP